MNNSAFTNSIAQVSLETAIYAYELVGKDPTRWLTYANKIYVPYDENINYHPEFDGYEIGKLKIEQFYS